MIDSINNILRYMFLNISTVYIFNHIINYKSTNKQSINIILSFLCCAFIALCYNIFIQYFNSLTTIVILCFLLSLANSILTKNKLYYSLICTLLSISITIPIFVLSVFISSMIFQLSINIPKSNPIILLLAVILASLIIFKIVNIKRFKYRCFVS